MDEASTVQEAQDEVQVEETTTSGWGQRLFTGIAGLVASVTDRIS